MQWLQVLILCGEDVGSNPAGKLFTPQKLSIHIPNPSLRPSLRRRRGRVPGEILRHFSVRSSIPCTSWRGREFYLEIFLRFLYVLYIDLNFISAFRYFYKNPSPHACCN